MRTHYQYFDPKALSKLSNLNLVARLVVEGFISGLHKSPYQGSSVEFAEHREYAPEFEPKHIDWKVYAKTDKYYVKQYEEETNLKAHLLLDFSGSMDYASGEATKLQYACYLAASLAYLMLRQGDSVGLITCDTHIQKYIPPRNNRTHLKVILDTLETLQPGGETHLSHIFHELAERIKRRALIIVISDLFDDVEAVSNSFKHFRHKKHEVIVFHVLDDAEINFPFTNPIIFEDLETGNEIHTNPRISRRYYLAEFNRFIEAYKRTCRDNYIDYVIAKTSQPFDILLGSYISKRIRM